MPGSDKAGPFGSDPAREPGFWCGAIFTDLLILRPHGWAPPDAQSWSGNGPGTFRGLLYGAGREASPKDVGKLKPREVVQAVGKLARRTGCSCLKVAAGLCEVAKVERPRARISRHPGARAITIRKAMERIKAGPLPVLEVKSKWTRTCSVCREAAGWVGKPQHGKGWCARCIKGRHEYQPH